MVEGGGNLRVVQVRQVVDVQAIMTSSNCPVDRRQFGQLSDPGQQSVVRHAGVDDVDLTCGAGRLSWVMTTSSRPPQSCVGDVT